MPEEMPNIEGENRPTSPEGSPKVEKPISEYSFRESFTRRQRLTRQKETASGDTLAKIEAEIVQVKEREDFLVGEVEQEGGLMGLDQDLGILRDMLDADELSPSHLFDARKIAPQLDNLAGLEPSDPHAGVREWYYRMKLDEIVEELRDQKGQTLRGQKRQPQGSPDSHGAIDTAFEQTKIRIEEIMQKLSSAENTPEEQGRLSEELGRLFKQQPQIYKSSFLDPEMGRGGEGLINSRKEGAEKTKDLFRKRLRILIEEQADQSFDQNWRLVYPLELTIMDLMPKGEENDLITPPKGETWKPFNLSELRSDLSKELQAYRNIHNFIYVYRRVGGVTPLIEAASLLPREIILVLLKTPEVADRLKGIEAQGERNLVLKTKKYKGVELTGAEKGELKKIEATVKELMVKPSSEDGYKDNFWANRIAGGLYSGLHESARHDLQVNESGDFFSDRLFHAKERAKGYWEETWGRTPRSSLYETVDLRLTGFWERIIGSKVGSFKTISEAEEYCKSQGISAVINEGIDEETEKRGLVLVSFDLSGAKFEDMIFSETGAGDEFKVRTDEVRQVNLKLDDADKIRKEIFDPRRFLDEPSMATIKKAYEVFKHLKGKKRSDWVRDVCREVVLLYRDTVHPWNESASSRSRKCPGQEIYPEMAPWTNYEVKSQLTKMTPPLTDADREKVLEEFVGTKAERRLKENTEAVGEVGKSMLGAFIKALFGLK